MRQTTLDRFGASGLLLAGLISYTSIQGNSSRKRVMATKHSRETLVEKSYGNQDQNYCLLLKKQKVYCLSKSAVHKVI